MNWERREERRERGGGRGMPQKIVSPWSQLHEWGVMQSRGER